MKLFTITKREVKPERAKVGKSNLNIFPANKTNALNDIFFKGFLCCEGKRRHKNFVSVFVRSYTRLVHILVNHMRWDVMKAWIFVTYTNFVSVVLSCLNRDINHVMPLLEYEKWMLFPQIYLWKKVLVVQVIISYEKCGT